MDIYVGNLSYQTQSEDLEKLFGQYGTVSSVRIITDRDTGRSKGFGFLEMPEADEAAEAIENLNGFELDGRALKVNESQPRPPRSDNRRGGGGGGGRRNNRW
ncbi:MAG TPA: RNA-binding protein [bacterium]|nr:RNA-binding protein [bacterium]